MPKHTTNRPNEIAASIADKEAESIHDFKKYVEKWMEVYNRVLKEMEDDGS